MSWALFVFLTILNIIRGMKKINIHVGSSAVLSWTIHNRTEDMLYINHNNRTITRIWPEKGYFKPTLEYSTRLNFSFVKQNLNLTLNLLLTNISELDEGLYTCYTQLRDKEISIVQLLVTGLFEEPRVTDYNNLSNDSPNDTTIPAEGYPLSETIWMPILTNILPGIAVSIMCLICGFFLYKSRKRYCKNSSINSSVIELDQPHDVIGNSVMLELVYNDTDLHTNYWTVGEDNTGGLHSVLGKACTSGNPNFGSRSCSIKQDDSLENLQEVHLQSDEDAYIHPL